MKNKIAKLIDLKSIITILLTVTLIVLVVGNMPIEDEAIKTLFTSVTTACFTYYFTKRNRNVENE